MTHHALKQGFTLTELLIVIAIISIVIFFGMDNFNTHIKRTRDDRRRSDLEQIANALELYRADNNGQYPDSNGWQNVTSKGYCGGMVLCVSLSGTGWPTDSDLYSGLVPDYIDDIPTDPLNTTGRGLYYFYDPVCSEALNQGSPNEIDCENPDRGCCGYRLWVGGGAEVAGSPVIQKYSKP